MVRSGIESDCPEDHWPVPANWMKVGISVMTISRAATNLAVRMVLVSLSWVLIWPIWMSLDSSVPVGHSALTIPGACCRLMIAACAVFFNAALSGAWTADPTSFAPIPGAPRIARPAVRALSKFNIGASDFNLSIAFTMDVMTWSVPSTAYCKAVKYVVKRLFKATDISGLQLN